MGELCPPISYSLAAPNPQYAHPRGLESQTLSLVCNVKVQVRPLVVVVVSQPGALAKCPINRVRPDLCQLPLKLACYSESGSSHHSYDSHKRCIVQALNLENFDTCHWRTGNEARSQPQ